MLLRERAEYYQLLEQTQRDGLEVTVWLRWFLQQIAAACEQAEAIIGRTLAKARFWLRFRTVELTERQRKVLNRLLDAGPGGFSGGMNTRKYASLSQVSRVTAYQELTDLVAKGCLVPTGKGGCSSVYDVPREKLC